MNSNLLILYLQYLAGIKIGISNIRLPYVEMQAGTVQTVRARASATFSSCVCILYVHARVCVQFAYARESTLTDDRFDIHGTYRRCIAWSCSQRDEETFHSPGAPVYNRPLPKTLDETLACKYVTESRVFHRDAPRFPGSLPRRISRGIRKVFARSCGYCQKGLEEKHEKAWIKRHVEINSCVSVKISPMTSPTFTCFPYLRCDVCKLVCNNFFRVSSFLNDTLNSRIITAVIIFRKNSRNLCTAKKKLGD